MGKKLDASIPKGGFKSLEDLHKYNLKRGMDVSPGKIRMTNTKGGLWGKNNSNKGGCFITTAVCKTLQKPDNCEELTRFRQFRDTFMRSSPEMEAEVEDYYEIAPKICAEIDKGGKASEKYAAIWETSLKPAFEALENGENQKAHDIYKEMTLSLKAAYLES